MTGRRSAPPASSAMLESLRGLGYTTATALADVIDNSVSAGADAVSVRFEWAGPNSWISVTDNGRGMSDAELETAMRLGARDPRSQRAANDLGRFGMGLKTASFSQARQLTVASKRLNEPMACLRWDLDDLGEESGGWLLHEGPSSSSEGRIAQFDRQESGTTVIWENLDRIITVGFTAQDMIDLIDMVEAHIAMTFHRLIDSGLHIGLNDRPVRPWDPFLLGNPGKALESVEYRLLGAPDVAVQCHVLPHKDLLKQAQYDAAAGPAGWTSQQGFYVYRNERLLLAGGWLGLGERGRRWVRDEPHRLARIRLDIPNNADAEWKINVLKSTASVPVRLRTQLQRLASETRETARRVFAHRGKVINAGTPSQGMPDVWATQHTNKGISYRISRDHDLVSTILERAGDLKSDVLSLLRLIEQTVPVQRIWLDTAEQKDPPVTNFVSSPPDDLEQTLVSLFEVLVEFRGLSPDEARKRLNRTPPFDRYPDIVDGIGRNS